MGGFDVFVSYARADRERVFALADALTRQGLEVWLDDFEIDTFASISVAITTGLEHSKALVAYYSTTYPQRRACQWELTAALLASQRQGRDPRERVLIVNPERDAGHVQPVELADARYAGAPAADDRAAWDALGARVAAHVHSLDGVLGELGGAERPRWFGRHAVGAARFVGRTRDIWAVHSALTAGAVGLISGQSTGDPVVKVVGMGGIGKSLLAREYALRYAAAYRGGVFWLSADGHDAADDNLPSDARDAQRDTQLLAFADDLGIDTGGLAPAQLRGVLARELDMRGDPFLWVVDDLPAGLDSDTFEQWLAPGRCGRSLVTTRSRRYEAIGAQINVGVLTKRDGLELLARHRAADGPEEQRAAGGLVDDLGGHALALDVAGAALAAQRGVRTYQEYRAALADSAADELELAAQLADELPGGHERSIAGTLMRSISQLDEAGLDFLRLAAQLAADPIPARLVVDVFARADLVDEPAARRYAVAGMQAAAARSLAETTEDGDARQVHALIARTMRLVEPEGARAAELQKAVITTLTGRLHEQRQVSVDGVLLAHARHLAAPLHDQQQAMLLHAVALHDSLRGDYPSARALQERVLATARRVLGDEHPNTLASMNNLAVTLHDQGDLSGARSLQEQLLAIERRVLGDEHPNTLVSMNNVAAMRREQGDLAGASTLHEQELAICRRVLGDEHPDTLTSMTNLATTLAARGEVAGARTLHEQTLAILRRVLGDEHPDTLTSMHNLAATLRAQGDLSGARVLQDHELAIRRRVLGDEHPHTLHSINNLAVTLQQQGDLPGARALHEQTLAIRRRVLGDEHPNTLSSMNNLGATLYAQGDLAGARTLLEQTLAILRRVLGDAHPYTQTSRRELAHILAELGEPSTRTGVRDRPTGPRRTRFPRLRRLR